MNDRWKENLKGAQSCSVCKAEIDRKSPRILSVYTHNPICLDCKQVEEKKSDYEDVAKAMISECLKKEGKPYGDPQGYCFHHFCPFKH
jgi:hypothetical protein